MGAEMEPKDVVVQRGHHILADADLIPVSHLDSGIDVKPSVDVDVFQEVWSFNEGMSLSVVEPESVVPQPEYGPANVHEGASVVGPVGEVLFKHRQIHGVVVQDFGG